MLSLYSSAEQLLKLEHIEGAQIAACLLPQLGQSRTAWKKKKKKSKNSVANVKQNDSSRGMWTLSGFSLYLLKPKDRASISLPGGSSTEEMDPTLEIFPASFTPSTKKVLGAVNLFLEQQGFHPTCGSRHQALPWRKHHSS